MRLTWKDLVATGFTAAAVGAWAAYAGGAGVTGLSGVRTTTLAVLALGIGACSSSGAADSGANLAPGAILGVLAMVLAVLALVSGSEPVLAALVGVMVLLWLVTTIRHAVSGWTGHAPQRPAR